MKQRTILLVDFGVMYGGGQIYLARLIKLLKGQAQFYVFCSNPQLRDSLVSLGVHVYPFTPVSHWGKMRQMLTGMAMLVYLRFRHRIDIVWINGTPEIIFAPLARILGCTAIATRHLSMDARTEELHRAANRNSTQLLFKRLAFTLNRMICVSAAVAADLTSFVAPRKLVSIPNWVPTLPEQVTVALGNRSRVKLLFVSRLQKYKGASLILEAMKYLNSRNRNYAVSLTIVGDGEYRQELELQAQGLDVHFAGFQGDTSPFYRDADIFVNPSIGPEGLPLVSLEAMSYGLPCIFSDLRVHSEITNNGEAAMLFHSGDARDLSSTIESLLAEPELLRKYGQLARSVVENRYSPEVARALYLKEIEL